MKVNKLLTWCCLSLTTAIATDNIETSFNYFGNISASKLNKSGYTLNNYNHDNVDNQTRFTPFSKLGGQLSVFYKDYTFTTQAMTIKNHGKYETDLTWFNVKNDLTDNASVKVGRIQTTILLNSDSLDIDYVHLWAKPPDEVYRILGIKTFDGIEFSYKNSFSDYNYNVTFTPYGKSEKNLNTTKSTNDKAILDNAMAIKFNIEKDSLVFQGSYTKADLNMPNEDSDLVNLRNALDSFGNDTGRFSFVDKKFRVWTLGLKYDYNDFILNSEYARIDITSLLPNMSTYFVLLGYRYNKFTPFYMYARNKADKEHFDTSNIIGTTGLKNSLNSVLYSTNTSQETSSLGLRYDVKPGIALTMQVDRMTTSNYGAEGSLKKRGILEYELGKSDEPVYMYTVGLSFAF